MSRFEGPQGIVTNGLVLNLDAGDPDSYTRSQPPFVEVLVVAGGASGGIRSSNTNSNCGGGGGGAGGLIYNSALQLTNAAAITVTVGAGAASPTSNFVNGNNGSNSVFGSLTAVGGGGGGAYQSNAVSGGSGGGGGRDANTTGGTSTAGQGFRGGNGGSNPVGSGGGGGAGQPGAIGTAIGGKGGDGLAFSISGTSTTYAGGGGGSSFSNNTTPNSGSGGGGNGAVELSNPTATAGQTNTGGGGGGDKDGAGGSGIVIVRYPGLPAATGGTIAYINGFTIHTFTTSGTFTPNLWNDTSGNGNNGTLVNGVGFNSFQNGGFLSFDGVDDRVIISPASTFSNYTVYFFCKWVSSVGASERLFGCDAFGTYTIFNPFDVGFHYNPLSNPNTTVTLASGINIGFGNWCQVAITVRASSPNVVIFINGIARNSSGTIPSANLSANIFLGSQGPAQGIFANCHFGNFIIYNRVLSATEITQNYNAQKARFGL